MTESQQGTVNDLLSTMEAVKVGQESVRAQVEHLHECVERIKVVSDLQVRRIDSDIKALREGGRVAMESVSDLKELALAEAKAEAKEAKERLWSLAGKVAIMLFTAALGWFGHVLTRGGH